MATVSTTGGPNPTVYTNVTGGITSGTFTSGAFTSTGNITISGGLTTSSWGSPKSGTLAIVGDKPTIKLDEGEIDLKLLLTMMKQMQSILCIIEEDIKQHEKYPALKDLYDQFRMVEAMVKAEEDGD